MRLLQVQVLIVMPHGAMRLRMRLRMSQKAVSEFKQPEQNEVSKGSRIAPLSPCPAVATTKMEGNGEQRRITEKHGERACLSRPVQYTPGLCCCCVAAGAGMETPPLPPPGLEMRQPTAGNIRVSHRNDFFFAFSLTAAHHRHGQKIPSRCFHGKVHALKKVPVDTIRVDTGRVGPEIAAEDKFTTMQ